MINIAVIEPSGKLYGSEMVLLDILKNVNRSKFSFTVFLPAKSQLSILLEAANIAYIETLVSASESAYKKIISYYNTNKEIVAGNFDLIFVNQAGILRPISILNNIRGKLPIVCEVSTLEDAHWMNKKSRFTLHRVKSFISNSNFISNNLNIKSSSKSTLYYGYEHKGLKRIEIAYQEQDFKIVLLGRISKSKGHFLLIDAAKQLRKYPFTFYIVGSAPSEDIQKDFERKISGAGLEDMFVLRGFQTDIQKELSGMHAMVVPSLLEPFGRIFCEAAEAGLPTVVSDSGGLGELARHFKFGLRFKANEPEDLAKKLVLLYENYEKIAAEDLSHGKRMLSRLNMKSYISRIEFLLEKAAANGEVSVDWLGEEQVIT
ncbi:glycosyltransferase family 4 protein [Cesiribacter sp. SM1]|uniref:glycosyltransferase family 4 protein n=1 Tax=Cesiribacter sp. SM1 TaxID=2861196 RepID=UPI001CD818D1|nr:glycosyltransferase family 4 protein [Cesiribacter sp. SM1]